MVRGAAPLERDKGDERGVRGERDARIEHDGRGEPSGPPGPRPKVGSGDTLFMIGLTVFEVVASILVVNYVKDHGGTDFAAYMWALVPPIVGAGVYWAKTRHASGASAAIVAFNLLGAAVGYFGSHDSRVLLYKDSVVTACVGLGFLATLLMRRPLTFWYGQRFATGGTPEGLAWWDSLWAYASFRRGQRIMTAIWGVIMLAEAGVKAFVIAHTSFKDAYLWTQVLPFAFVAVGIVITVVYAKRMQARGEAAGQAAAQANSSSDDTLAPQG